jgi:RNA polymerase sigma factor (sigma-70 family)
VKNTPFDIPLPHQLPRQVQLKRLQAVVEEVLTPAQRDILLDYYYRQKRISDIARDRGVHRSTVSRTLSRARKNLQDYLKY